MYKGWQIRREYELEHTRLIMSATYSSAFGAKKAVQPNQIFVLKELDNMPKSQRGESVDDFLKRFSEKEIKAGRLKPGELIQVARATKE